VETPDPPEVIERNRRARSGMSVEEERAYIASLKVPKISDEAINDVMGVNSKKRPSVTAEEAIREWNVFLYGQGKKNVYKHFKPEGWEDADW